MIRVKFYQKDKLYIGFSVIGHAGYAKRGKDIVCSAVSALVINTINSISELTDSRMIAEYGQGGMIRMKVRYPEYVKKAAMSGDLSREKLGDEYDSVHSTQLLIRSLRIGLCNIYEEYGDKFIRLYFKEV